MLIEQTTEELAAAQPIQSRCTLTDVLLCESAMRSFGKEEEFEAPLTLKFTHSATGSLSGRVLTVLAHFTFKSVDGSEIPVPVFDLHCTFRLLYELKEDFQPTQMQIDAFKKGNAVYNCWPYVREFVQNLASRMGFQPPPLPLLRVNVVEAPAKTEIPSALPQPS
jgi:hypothetical protein